MKTTASSAKKEYKVFVVDDNQLFLKSIVRNLKDKLHCNVQGFVSAEDCLNNLDKNPSLIISDFYLDSDNCNKMNGDGFLNKLKNIRSHVPVVIYSGNHSMDLALKTLKLGAKDFVPKDDHGFEKITRASNHVLQYLKRQYEENADRKNLVGMSALIGTLIITVLLVSKFHPDFLPVVFISALVGGILFSLINIFSVQINWKFNLNSQKTKIS